MLLQVKYVEMVKQQDDAYKEAVEECRARTQTNNGTSTLPQRQISNYFVQFRKVPQFFFFSCISAFNSKFFGSDCAHCSVW